MIFLEKDLENIIFENSNNLLLSKGLNIKGKKIRQLNIGNYGIADIVTYYKESTTVFITIYELKLEVVNIGALMQVLRYRKGVETYINQRCFNLDIDISICLIGKKIDTKSDFVYLASEVNKLSIFEYNFDINGLSFNYIDVNDYNLVNKGF